MASYSISIEHHQPDVHVMASHSFFSPISIRPFFARCITWQSGNFDFSTKFFSQLALYNVGVRVFDVYEFIGAMKIKTGRETLGGIFAIKNNNGYQCCNSLGWIETANVVILWLNWNCRFPLVITKYCMAYM